MSSLSKNLQKPKHPLSLPAVTSSETTMSAGVCRRLEGKVALITGGASGIGECTVRLFAGEGATVVIADIQDEMGQSLCKDLLGSGQTVSYVHCDVTVEDQIKHAVDLCVSKYGKLDVMFNNAGIVGDINPNILTAKMEDFKKVLDVNLLGGFAGAKHAARVMIPAKKGSIIFTSSMASVICTGSSHAYTASKHALVGLTKNLSVELGSHGIRVNCISPFATVTPMLLKTNDPAMKRQMEEYIALSANLKGAVMEAEDVAKAALYLASDDAKYVSGLNLVVDGGFSVTNLGLNPSK